MISRRVFSAAILSVLSASSLTPALAQTPAGLVPHRAVYNLELAEASERSGISNMFGRMVYEFTGSACEGWRVNFRFVTQLESGGEKKTTDQQSSTFEDPKSGRFEFESRTYNEDRLEKEVNGFAERKPEGIAVDITSPEEKQVDLAKARFPTQHTLDVLNIAAKGQHFYEARIFDGSDDGDKTLVTSTVVGAPVATDTDAKDLKAIGALKDEKAWPVTIAYFEDGKMTDALPNYRMSFKLFPNGVSRDLTMDYGDFVLKGSLVKLDMLPGEGCKSK
ncbi:cell envelope integrity EipB family protein [Rhizobium sp. TRM95796]|uniref:cell envelope integrity EipB family protein n=1 Tax=Rhizobium sp. TRM95796 TaxID=2979862 RepID=UPI0021E96CC3|nr:cell envelope integrity EipB family protein [Rhizobium sp. TRM95796]MCV3764129.1 cell envelope integrity EipB family protein [Rhizobium sp. TRM95796]